MSASVKIKLVHFVQRFTIGAEIIQICDPFVRKFDAFLTNCDSFVTNSDPFVTNCDSFVTKSAFLNLQLAAFFNSDRRLLRPNCIY